MGDLLVSRWKFEADLAKSNKDWIIGIELMWMRHSYDGSAKLHAMNALPDTMHAVHLIGHGGFDMLEYRTDVPVPVPAPHQLLVKVGAAGVNNTDINTRIGWYAKEVTSGTAEADLGGSEATKTADADLGGSPSEIEGGWDGALSFPRIQGADMSGTVVAVGSEVSRDRLGERVLVRSMQTAGCSDPTGCETIGSEFDGGFAQFCAVDATEAFPVASALTDVELASFPCAYSTAEGMLHKIGLCEHGRVGERVLITGASGGVGSAAIQLAKRRGAEVVAVASKAKWPDLEPLGADQLVDRNVDLVAEFGEESFDVIVDVVAGPGFGALLDISRRQGRYVTSGAIAGPIVELDVRTLYLKDLTLAGSTRQPRVVFENLVRYIEDGDIIPVVANTYPLSEVVNAQTDFLEKKFAGKLVLVPPRTD